jgi:cbb3-type cytochrome oxidase subunit 1
MGARLLKIAVVYFLISVVLGMYMSISKNFDLVGVHAHIALFGWASLGIAGIIYTLFPAAENHSLGKWHFWLHNIGLLIMIIGLFAYVSGATVFEPVIAIGSIIAVLGIICFAVNVWKNVKA